jgi:EAL domain-containing protein (putative c-di-GMP-specific phosphodiesterase class I)
MAVMRDVGRAVQTLQRLREVGVGVALDDFGTGYSSLSYLLELPLSAMKLDRSFVTPILADPRAERIVRYTVALAHEIGCTVIAEGVEDAATAGMLTACGCDAAQGWYFGRAMPAAQFSVWLSGRGRPRS